jgi:hypothetical protein
MFAAIAALFLAVAHARSQVNGADSGHGRFLSLHGCRQQEHAGFRPSKAGYVKKSIS